MFCLYLCLGYISVLVCVFNKDVVDCLVFILVIMMIFFFFSIMTVVNFVCFRKDNLSRMIYFNLGSRVSFCSNNVGFEDGYNENDFDSEIF